MASLTESPHAAMMYSVEQFQDMAFRNESAELTEAVIALLKYVESQLEIVEYPAAAESSGPTNARANTGANTSGGGFKSGGMNRNNHHNNHSSSHDNGNKSNGAGSGTGGYRNKFDMSAAPSTNNNNNNTNGRKNTNTNNNNTNAHRDLTDGDWEAMRSFKTTKIETKTGIEKQVNDLRVHLNKMSKATYDKQCAAIVATFREYFAPENTAISDENTTRLSKSVFDIASTNKFYAELYANLIQTLVQEFDVFRKLLAEFAGSYCATATKNIVYVDPDVDYDGFCAYNKQSDIRKSTATFIMCCLARGLVELSDVIDIVVEFIDSIMRMKDEQGKTKELEEITELVFIMVPAMHELARKDNMWKERVMRPVYQLSIMKVKDHVSLSNRSVFKFMDLMEKL